MTRCGSFDWGGKKISFKGKSSARSKSNGHENKYVCRSCGETGHLKEDCKKRGKKNSEKGKETKNSNEVNQVEVFSSSGVEEELLMAGYSSEYHQNWCRDELLKVSKGNLIMKGIRVDLLYKLLSNVDCVANVTRDNDTSSSVCAPKLDHISGKGMEVFDEEGFNSQV
ncbi:hypothetical protein Dimus_030503 [Dionaea muscipula]